MTPNTAVTARTADAANASAADVSTADVGTAGATIADHHRVLSDRLAELADSIYEAAADGEPDAESVALFGWCRSELLPHLKACDTALVGAVGSGVAGSGAVGSGAVGSGGRVGSNAAAGPVAAAVQTVGDAIRTRAEELENADSDMAPVATAGALVALFDVHASQVEAQLLPALADAGVDVGGVISAAPELTGGRRAPAKPTAGQSESGSGRKLAELDPITGLDEVDVRPLPHQARHNVIFGKLQALTDTGEIVITNDHDPKPLRYQTDALWPGVYQWNYLEEGPEAWRVSIVRADGEKAVAGDR